MDIQVACEANDMDSMLAFIELMSEKFTSEADLVALVRKEISTHNPQFIWTKFQQLLRTLTPEATAEQLAISSWRACRSQMYVNTPLHPEILKLLDPPNAKEMNQLIESWKFYMGRMPHVKTRINAVENEENEPPTKSPTKSPQNQSPTKSPNNQQSNSPQKNNGTFNNQRRNGNNHQNYQPVAEQFHGYTYSAHPLACAAGIGTLDTYAEEGLLTRAKQLQGYFAEAVHALRGEPNVIDIRNIGLVGGVELAPLAGEPAKRAFNIFLDCYDKGVLVRVTGDILALSPPLIVERAQIDQMVDTLRGAIRRTA